MKRGGRNAGFTLAETMIVFALIAILGGLAYINIIEQKKNLNFMEYNETAKEIFLAAQEHLSAAYAKRELHDFDKNVGVYGPLYVSMDNPTDFGSHISGNLYALYIKGGELSTVSGGELSTASGGKLAYDTMLPKGSILPGQNFAILYDRDTYRVLDVFYTGAEYNFSSWGTETVGYATWKEHFSKLSKNYLKNFPVGDGHTIIMGYYGQVNVSGASVESGGSFNPFTEDHGEAPTPTTPPSNGINPGLMIVNGSVLYALVTLDSNYKYDNGGGIKLELTQKSPAPGILNTVVQLDVFQKGKDITANEGDSQKLYLVVLDDVTTISGSFTQIASGITPGANIEAVVKADGYISDPSIMLHGESNAVTCNSLFADNSTPNEVHIQNFRHLQNLANSGLGANLTGILDQSLGWSEFKKNISTYRNTYFASTTFSEGYTGEGAERIWNISYQPINPTKSLTLKSSSNRIYKIRGLELPNKENSGLFGTLEHDTEIERIEMEGTSVAGTPTNAGALIGTVTAGEVTVRKVASYGKEWATASKDGEATTITASGSAGGLVGAITGGTVTLNKCAAAHLVTATGGNAGGLVGSVASGATLNVTFSYAGSGRSGEKGKQKDGHGNLIKNVEGAYAGGLIGRVEGNNVTLTNSYSTASAYGTTAAGNLYTASDTVTVTKRDVVYGAGSYQVSSGGISKGAAVSAPNGDRKEGSPYNHDLKNDTWKNFPYKSVEIMGGGDAAAWWTSTHIGDWPPIDNLPTANAGTGGTTETATKKTIANDNVRYAWIQIPEGITPVNGSVITLAVSNPGESDEAEKAVLYTYRYDGAAWSPIDSAPPIESGSSLDPALDTENHTWLRVPLDDITTPGHRFRDLYAGVSADKPVCVRAGIDTQTLDFASLQSGAESLLWNNWTPGGAQYPNTGYVLFDIAETASDTHTAGISNIRHLQNLDTSVSGVGNTFTKAELLTDLDETAATWPGGSAWTAKSIQVGASATAKSFYGISNANLTEFNGNNKTLSNFTIDRTLDDGNGLEKDAGLFRALSPMAESEAANKATVYGLTLENFTVKAGTDGNAGALAAVVKEETGKEVRIRNIWIKEPGGVAEAAKVGVTADKNAGGAVGVVNTGGKLKIEQVLVQSKKNSVTSSGSGAAGGLVGANGGTLTIDNSAATMYVSATNGAAGGLIGLIADNKSATVTDSYAGGHTAGGKYAAADWNVKSTSGAAGGLVGEVASGATLSAAQSFSAASVQGATAAGGVIGTASGTVTFTNSVYAAGPVSNVSKQKVTWTNPTLKLEEDGDATNAGAFLGTGSAVSLTNAFYLPQIYSDGELLQFKTSNIAYLGVSDNNKVFYNGAAESLGFSAASYGDATSPIAGKQNSNKNLQYKTFHCDKGQTTEYPFAVWTKFTFDQDNASNTEENSYYYGDFEVVQNTSTIKVTVKFQYQLVKDTGIVKPLDDSQSREVPYTKYEGLSVLPPSLPHVDGYEFDYWQLSTGSGGTGNVQFTSGAYDPLEITRNQIVKALGNEPKADKKNEAGTITEDNSATRIITVTAVYKPTTNNHTVQYMRPKTPEAPNTEYEPLMTEKATKDDGTVKTWGDLKPLKPFLSGYDFDGYYLDPADDSKKVFNSDLTAVNSADTIAPLQDGQPLALYMRFTKIQYYHVNVSYKYKTVSGAADYAGEYATRSYRFKVGETPDGLDKVPLYDTEATLDKIYRQENPETDLKAEHISGNTFNLADTLENDDKAANATTNYYVCYNAEPVTTQHYRVQYRLMHTEKSDNAVARPLPDYIQYEAKQATDENTGQPKVDDEGNPVMVNDYDKRPLEIAAPKYAKYNSGENSKYEYYPAFDTNGKIQVETYTVTGGGHEYKQTTKVAAENDIKTFTQSHIPDPESMQGFTLYAVSYGGIDKTHDGTSAKPFLITYTYERDKYFLTFNTSGGTNFPQFERYFGQLVNDASQTMNRVKVEFNSGTGVVKLLKQNGAETTNPVEAGTETVPQTLSNVIPYRQGYRLCTETEEGEDNQAFWRWRATASSSRDATEGNRVNVFMTNYEGLTMPATDMTAKAYYKPTQSSYKIVLLLQRVDDKKDAADKDKSYTQYNTEDIVVSAPTESVPVPERPAESGNEIIDYRLLAPTNFHYRGYAVTTQRRVENADGSASEVDSVMGDGSTVVNVFYDRDLRTLLFLKNKSLFNGTGYVPATGDNDTQYGYVNGDFKKLESEETTEYQWWTTAKYQVANDNWDTQYRLDPGSGFKEVYYWNRGWYETRTVTGYSLLGKPIYSYSDPYEDTRYKEFTYNNFQYTDKRWRLNADNTWTEVEAADETLPQYGRSGTTIYTLKRKSVPTWFYTDGDGHKFEYTGDRYVTQASDNSTYVIENGEYIMTGLYGQTLDKYAYEWPSTYYWHEGSISGSGMTFLASFLNNSTATDSVIYMNGAKATNRTTRFYSNSDLTGEYYYYHYKQNLDGTTYPDTSPNDTPAYKAKKGYLENFSFTSKYADGFTVNKYKDKDHSQMTNVPNQGTSVKENTYVYHKRNQFTLTVKVDGVEKQREQVYYDQPLYQIDWLQTLTEQLASPSALANEAEGTVYKYWCPDPDCDQHTLAWDTDLTDDEGNVIQSITTMPANDMTIYAKKIPPTYYVRFQLDDPDENQKPSSPAYEDGATGNPEPVGTLKDGNIDSQVTSDSGGLLKAYSPVSNDSNYTFDGWYTKSRVKFYSSMPITPDVASEEFTAMAPDTDALGNVKKDDDGHPVKKEQTVKGVTLYPKWKYVGTEYANVRIRCFYTTKNEEGQPVKTYIPFTYKYQNGEDWVTASSGDDDKLTVTLKNVGTVGQNYTVDVSKVTLGDGFASYDYKPGARITNVKKNPGDTENLIELEFYDTAWKYEFEYWVRLRNLTHGTGEQWLPIQKDAEHPNGGYESNDSESFAKLVRKPGGISTGESETVTISKPLDMDGYQPKLDGNGQSILDPSYAGYMVVGYRLLSESENAESTDNTSASIQMDDTVQVSPGADRSKPVIIRVYLEVDPTLIQLADGSQYYNGMGHDWDIAVNDDNGEISDEKKWKIKNQENSGVQLIEELDPPDNLEAPENVSYTAYRQYWDMSKTPPKNPDGGLPKNSGTYAETVYITAQYAGKTYLLWKSADFEGSDNTTYLTINPLAITLKSDSAERDFNGEPLTAETVYVTSGAFVAGDVDVTTEGEKTVLDKKYVTFAVDSFRRSKGTTANIFEVNLPDGIAQNYNITKEYGTLTVK